MDNPQSLEAFLKAGTFESKDGRRWRPTTKQIGTVKTLMENPGISLGQALRENGYSDTSADNPKEVMASKGMIALMDRPGSGMTDGDLHRIHEQQLSAVDFKRKKIPMLREGGKGMAAMTDDEIYDFFCEKGFDMIGVDVEKNEDGKYVRYVEYFSPIYEYRDRALDKAYNIKGSYAPKKLDTKNLNYNFSIATLRRKSKQTREAQVKNGQ